MPETFLSKQTVEMLIDMLEISGGHDCDHPTCEEIRDELEWRGYVWDQKQRQWVKPAVRRAEVKKR